MEMLTPPPGKTWNMPSSLPCKPLKCDSFTERRTMNLGWESFQQDFELPVPQVFHFAPCHTCHTTRQFRAWHQQDHSGARGKSWERQGRRSQLDLVKPLCLTMSHLPLRAPQNPLHNMSNGTRFTGWNAPICEVIPAPTSLPAESHPSHYLPPWEQKAANESD